MLKNSKIIKYISLFLFMLFLPRINYLWAEKIQFVVPAHNIAYHELITNDSLGKKYFSINPPAASRYVLNIDQAVGKIAKTILLKNHPILLRNLKQPMIVEQGKQVKLIVKNGSLVITSIGIPLQSGSAGDYIKVKNIDSGIIVSGTILKDGSVGVSAE